MLGRKKCLLLRWGEFCSQIYCEAQARAPKGKIWSKLQKGLDNEIGD